MLQTQRNKNSRSLQIVTMVGLAGFEPATSPLSGVRSNQLSYRPEEQNIIDFLTCKSIHLLIPNHFIN